MPWVCSAGGAATVAAFAYIPQRPLAWALAAACAVLTLAMLVFSSSNAAIQSHSATGLAKRELRWRDEGWDVLGREIQEHRRYERSLAVCRLPASQESSRRAAAAAAGEFAASLWPHLRVGASAYVDGGDVVLILPSTDRGDTKMMLNRLERALGVTGIGNSAAVAVFPDDALTAGALIESVRGVTGASTSDAPEPNVLPVADGTIAAQAS
jgi:hypothetical protein